MKYRVRHNGKPGDNPYYIEYKTIFGFWRMTGYGRFRSANSAISCIESKIEDECRSRDQRQQLKEKKKEITIIDTATYNMQHKVS